MTLLDFAEEMWGSTLDPADLDFRIWLAWHDEPARLYLAFVAADDLYKNTYTPGSDEDENSMVLQDNIFLGIDADHSGGQAGSLVPYKVLGRHSGGSVPNSRRIPVPLRYPHSSPHIFILSS